MPVHSNSFEAGIDVPETMVGRRHRRRRQGAGENKTQQRRPLKAKLPSLAELPELSASEAEDSTDVNSSDADALASQSECSGPHSPSGEVSTVDLQVESWPSLHEAADDGWDLCSEVSVVSDTNSTKSWVQIDVDRSPAMKPYAALLAGNPSAGKPAQWPILKKTTLQKTETPANIKSEAYQTAESNGDKSENVTCIDDDFSDDFGDFRPRGWQKSHKSSLSVAAMRKVDYQKARRDLQRQQFKEAACEEEDE